MTATLPVKRFDVCNAISLPVNRTLNLEDKGECAETRDADEAAKPPGEASRDEESGSLKTHSSADSI